MTIQKYKKGFLYTKGEKELNGLRKGKYQSLDSCIEKSSNHTLGNYHNGIQL